mmetsp:Transcript_4685/g.14624  ORF Transcript_4685/g.14624 Transcript_4685/m.14624 type:complete len:268 (+) Transcript_4685:38-841(+)|eukprot:CAMPEP_0198658028 /NCGR_PEP_ID=MMETSP1467-20131203/21701_1 /TAXON_ID=1462469 /ORGANISM="unid. sp., Strain CCMP2135" /LENGTH=267 /DNA_ID=CAMNT_0044394273 /DNA_START=37 /DNA_END=840 /DNA_ORIENTATION=+
MDFAAVSTEPGVTSSSNDDNIRIDDSNLTSGYLWLVFSFDFGLEKGIKVQVCNFKEGATSSRLTLEVAKCKYLGINNASDGSALVVEEEVAAASKEVERLRKLAPEDLRTYLRSNVVPLVKRKVFYTKFRPQFTFFLSHKTRDKPAMRSLKSGLQFLGYATWLDESDVQMGANLQANLKLALDRCDCLIAWLTKEYFESDYCNAELKYARSIGRIIIPFGDYGEIKDYLVGDFGFLKDHLVADPRKSFFEILRRIDSTLYNFQDIVL